jgi:formamidopyrimidine-DNA glycosylase
MRDKIKLVSSAGTGHFYTTTKNKRPPGQDGDQEIRSRGTQARDLQGSEDQVIGWCTGDVDAHPLLASLGPEPLEAGLDVEYLVRKARGRRAAVKIFLMDQRIVVGVGNIYVSEALFRAGIRPRRAAGRVRRAEWERVVTSIRDVLGEAIEQGGTTLRDYVNAAGTPGYFRQQLFVYERNGEPCRRCATTIRQLVQGQRSTYFCPTCQK